MQAIQTKYLGATNCKPARVKAICRAKARIYSRYELEVDNPNANVGLEAAKRLAKELGWDYGTWHGGTLADKSDVWVCEAKYNGESFEAK